MKSILFAVCMLAVAPLYAQDSIPDALPRGTVSVYKDSRIDQLGKKMADYNESLSMKTKMVNGYRLMLLTTSDRNTALQVRAQLLQLYPEHKIYMIFQSPYIKIKFGNFLDKSDAEKIRKQILAAKIVTGNVYVLPEKVEQKPEKSADGKSDD